MNKFFTIYFKGGKTGKQIKPFAGNKLRKCS